MFVTNWISTTKIQKISEITNFFRHYFLSRTEVEDYSDNNYSCYSSDYCLLPVRIYQGLGICQVPDHRHAHSY